MALVFRPMTSEEVAARDAALAAQKERLGARDGRVYWIARAAGYGLHYDHAAALWDRGMILADMNEITDEAVEEMLRW